MNHYPDRLSKMSARILLLLAFFSTALSEDWRLAALSDANLVTAENELAVVVPSGLSTSLTPWTHNISVLPGAIYDGTYVTVAYNSSAPAWGDWVGLYSSSSADISSVAPIKWAYIDDKAYLSQGSGSRRFQVISMRSPTFALYLFSGGLSKGVARAAVNLSFSGDPYAPQRARVAMENASHLRLTWSSGRSPAASPPTLAWGLSPSALRLQPSAPIASHTLQRTALCGPPANASGYLDLGYTHSALLDLTQLPSRPLSLYYSLGDSVAGASAPVRATVPSAPATAAEPAAPLYPHTILAFDDMGRGSGDDAQTWSEYGAPSLNTSRFLDCVAAQNDSDSSACVAGGGGVGGGRVQLVWLVGDVSYSTGYLAVWEWWLFMVSRWTAHLPLLIGLGNRELLGGRPAWHARTCTCAWHHFCLLPCTPSPLPPPLKRRVWHAAAWRWAQPQQPLFLLFHH